MNSYLSATGGPGRSTLRLRCESNRPRWARQCHRGEASGSVLIRYVLVLCDGIYGDVHSQLFELSDEASGLLLGGTPPIVPVRPEVLIGNPVADDVVVGDENVVACGADRFLGAAPAADLGVVRGEVGALGAGGGLRGFGQRDTQPHRPVPGPCGPTFPAGG